MSASTSSTVLLVVHLAILCGVHGQHTYWIASNTSQCGGRTPCQTLDSYAKDNASLFSTSHAMWVFLRGEHYLSVDIFILYSMNITLTGENPCIGIGSETCSTIIMSEHLSGGLLVYNVKNITMTYLNCFHEADPNNAIKLTLKYVQNLSIQAITLDIGLYIFYPRGDIFISQLSAKTGLYIEIVIPTNTVGEESLVNVTINNSTFELANEQDRRNNIIDIQITGAIHYRRDVGPVQCHDNSTSTAAVTLHFNHCVFRHRKSPVALQFLTNIHCSKVVISDSVFINNRGYVLLLTLMGPHHVHLENTHFLDNAQSDIMMGIFATEYYVSNPRTTDQEEHFIPNIRVENCTFVNNTVQNTLMNIHFEPSFKASSRHTQNGMYLPIGFYGHNTFTYNMAEIEHDFFLEILTLNKVLAIVDGTLEIENNTLNGSVMRISPNSRMLFQNNSGLRILNNNNSAIQLLVDYTNFNIGGSFRKLFKLIENWDRDNGDGTCLFQFVDDNGMYIAEDDLEYFNASIVLSNGGPREKASKDTQQHYLIYNAKLQNCTLTLREGNKTIEEDEKRRILKLDSWDETTIGSPAYYACTCDPTQPDDRNLWDCSSGTITKTVYPGLLVKVGLVALGDYGFVQKAKFTTFNTELRGEELIAYSKGCTELFSLTTHSPGDSYTFEAKIYALLRYTYDEEDINPETEFAFSKGVLLQVRTNCPSGFQLSPSDNGTTCDCNQLLTYHHFQCFMTARGIRTEITYKSFTSNYWMGYSGQQLVISDHCPSHYCNTVNSTISTTGLTTEDINTTIQCDPNSNRQGLLCSQCTPGTSSQFGSFRCTQCTFAGLLLVPLGAVAGIVLIVLLFLFNFTVLQGNIIGIAFYANVVGIMDEFVQQYSIRPFYIPLALINLGFGFETCFFDGMGEFTKAIMQFIFPSYLIALTIIITAISHKFERKICFRFLARRSVPVLATIMLLTYSGLINAVIYGLQYTHIYNVDSGTHEVVWLHQPELEYFKGKHIAVGVLCLLTLLLHFLPLTIVTLFADQIKNKICSRRPLFSHFFDAFQGAFQYPFGFWFGTRLLFRIVFITLNITTNTSVVVYTIFLTTGSILLLQLLMEPFRTDNITIYRPDPERKITRTDLMKSKISKIFRPKVIDSLYLLNMMLLTTVATISTSIGSVYTTVGVCLSISLALAQLTAVTVHHGYHYFPLPESTRHKMDTLRERYIELRERRRERRARRNQVDTLDSAPVQIHYLSASMCFNSEEYPSSSSSSGEESDSKLNRDDETREETEDETRGETDETRGETEDEAREETTEM